ncbi:MAG: hypothetical protein ABW189_06775 [Rickettsiales bacterium]
MSRWGKEATAQYFRDIDKVAVAPGRNNGNSALRHELTDDGNVKVYPAREHYIVYCETGNGSIAILAFIRQGRNVPELLKKYAYVFNREMRNIQCRPPTKH